MALPKTTQDRILADAASKYPNTNISYSHFNNSARCRKGYIVGATAEAERAQKIDSDHLVIIGRLKEELRDKDEWAQNLVAALDKIIEMNRQQALDQYGEASKAETWGCVIVARNALRKRNAGKEVEKEHAANICGICKERPLGNGITVCDECYENFDGDRRGLWDASNYH